MVRTKVEIKRIEDKAKRHTTFTKRRQGLFKKTNELCKRCNAQAAVITFSLAGNAFAFGYPSVESVLTRYNSSDQRCIEDGEDDRVEAADAVSDDDDDRKLEDMSMEELDVFGRAMEILKQKVVDRINDITKSQ